jgi:hypothetical protein
MAYYDALIAAWATTVVPAGYNGTPLNVGMTTAQKLAAVNGWKKATAASATTLILPSWQVYDAIDSTEYNALTDTQRQEILSILGMGQVNAQGHARTRFLAIFPAGTQTRTNLAALISAATPTVLWVTEPASNGGAGLASPVSLMDLTAAGGLS